MPDSELSDWQPSYSVGNVLLDDQHKKLLSLARKALSCMEEQGELGHENFHDILHELSRYIELHFATEEAILRESSYPLLDTHIEEHRAYQLSFTEMLLDASMEKVDKVGLSDFLSSWWIEHILCSDKQYASTLRGQHL
mgnify:CR=1 FL=1|jgi:hemerythrin